MKERIDNVQIKYSILIYPNPCDSISHVNFMLDNEESVKFILSGKNKAASVIFNNVLKASAYDIAIDLTGEKSGVYFLELQIGDYVDRIQILKN